MKSKKQLLDEISQLTLEIERKYPELYVFLDEMPDTIPSKEHPRMDETVLQQHLDSLHRLIDNYKKSHKNQ